MGPEELFGWRSEISLWQVGTGVKVCPIKIVFFQYTSGMSDKPRFGVFLWTQYLNGIAEISSRKTGTSTTGSWQGRGDHAKSLDPGPFQSSKPPSLSDKKLWWLQGPWEKHAPFFRLHTALIMMARLQTVPWITPEGRSEPYPICRVKPLPQSSCKKR